MLANYANAQTRLLDSVIVIDEVNVSTARVKDFNTGYKTENFDTILVKNLQNQSLADLLLMNNAVYIKNYSTGALATPSLRGTGANHTAVVWNGINLQSNMNGTLDLSMVPLSNNDEVYLQYGAASSLYGSGAIGGSINLNNKAQFNQGNHFKISSGIGSFQTIPILLDYSYSNTKWNINLKPYFFNSKNDFSYYDNNNQLKSRTHNDYLKLGMSTEFYYKISNNQLVSIKYWQQNSNRNLAPALTQSNNSQSQKDASYRALLEWNKHHHRYNLNFKSAFLHDFLQYADSSTNINSVNRTNSFINELETKININEYQQIDIGINNTLNIADSENYPSNPKMNKLAFFAAYKFSFKKINTTLSARKEFVKNYSTPVVPALGIEYKVFKSLTLKGNLAGCYRIPTFNDLYWQNVGNPDLKPEIGYQMEGGAVYSKSINKLFNINFSANIYNAIIDNWIIWLPNGSIWTPQNLMQVHSRGVETNLKLTYQNKSWLSSISANSNYRLSTNEKAKLANDASLGKQLIYVPMYSFSGTYIIQYKKMGLVYNQTYNGYRYTSSDNSSYLLPYSVTNVQLYYEFQKADYKVKISLLANNLFNTNYQTVKAYPMPLANYQLNLSFSI